MASGESGTLKEASVPDVALVVFVDEQASEEMVVDGEVEEEGVEVSPVPVTASPAPPAAWLSVSAGAMPLGTASSRLALEASPSPMQGPGASCYAAISPPPAQHAFTCVY